MAGPRQECPDPDPLEVVYFADADPVFALAETPKRTRRLSSRACHRRLPAHDQRKQADSGDLDGSCAAGVGRGHDGRAWFREVRRPELVHRGDQRTRGDRLAVRPGAGEGARRGTFALPGRARRPDRTAQPPGADRRTSTRRLAAGQARTRPALFFDLDRLQDDQRLPRPQRGRLVHPRARRTAARGAEAGQA